MCRYLVRWLLRGHFRHENQRERQGYEQTQFFWGVCEKSLRTQRRLGGIFIESLRKSDTFFQFGFQKSDRTAIRQ